MNYQPKHLEKKESPKNTRLQRIFATYGEELLLIAFILIFAIILIANYDNAYDHKAYLETSNTTTTNTDGNEYIMASTTNKNEYTFKNLQYTIETHKCIEEYTYMGELSEYVSSPMNLHSQKEEPTIDDLIGRDTIEIDESVLVRYDLPDKYYPGIDYSSFQPYMPYTAITNKSTPAYKVVRSENCYTDEFGLRRYKTNDSQFTIDGQDDYIIALGTFYKEKGTAGSRYLIVTTTGMYTAITGDEKADEHTDAKGMFSRHCNGTKAGLIEWIVDKSALNPTIKKMGTVTYGGPEAARGEILYIYKIN